MTIDNILARMTLEHKAGQVMMFGFDGVALDAELRALIEQVHPGGVVLFARNVESPRQLAQLDTDLLRAAKSNGDPGLIISIDQEGGRVARLRQAQGFAEFPSARDVGAARDPAETARQIARALAAEMKAAAINMDLAPVLDVNNNPTNPVINDRSFGADPARVTACGVAFIQTLQAEGIMAVGKHFPGHGDTTVDSHIALPIVDPTPNRAATLSSKVMTDLLRDELKFTGIRMTDSLEMGALQTSGYPVPRAATTALQAGADMLLFNCGHALNRAAHTALVDAVTRGEIPMARLDEAVRRVLTTKERFGIL